MSDYKADANAQEFYRIQVKSSIELRELLFYN